MRAITSSPGVKDSADLEELPEPDPSEGGDPRRRRRAGHLRDRRRDRPRRLRRGAARRGAADPRPRVARARGRGARRQRLRARRPRRRHRPAPGPGAVRVVRGGGVGLLPQRRATPSAGSRRCTASAPSAGGSSRSSPSSSTRRWALLGVLMEPTTIVAKAWEQIDRIAQRATIAPRRVLVTGAGPIGLLAALLARAARAGGACARPGDRRPEARAGPRPGRALLHRRRARPRPAAGRDRRGDRRRGRGRRRDELHRAERDRLPDGHLLGRPHDRARRRHAQPQHRARERRRLRLGQREPPALRGGGGGAGRGRPSLAGAAHHPPRAAGLVARRARRARITTSRSWSSWAPPSGGPRRNRSGPCTRPPGAVSSRGGLGARLYPWREEGPTCDDAGYWPYRPYS